MNSAKGSWNTLLLLSLLLCPICISLDTITPNQPLKDCQLLLSNQKTFALGFFNPGNSSYRYVGIWYKQITEQPLYGLQKETLVDQRGMVLFWVCSSRFPFPLMERTPKVSLRGLFMFATHTTVCSVICLYQIPT